MPLEHENVQYKRVMHLNMMLVNIAYCAYHEHKDFEMLAIIGGEAKIRTRTAEFNVREGSVTAFNYRAAHEIDALGGELVAVVMQASPYFCHEYTSHCRRMMVKNPDVTGAVSPELNEELSRLLCNMLLHYCQDDRLFELRCIEDILRAYILLAENVDCEYISANQHHSMTSAEHKLDEISSYLDGNYQMPVRLEDVAAVVEMSPSYLSHFFSKNMGLTFQDYLNNLRFEHALRQIDRTNMALADVALGSGFSDPKYMTKMFVKNLGCTPQQYRKKIKEEGGREIRAASNEPYQIIYSSDESVKIVTDYLNKKGGSF